MFLQMKNQLLCKRGGSSKELVELLEHKLPVLLQEYKTPFTVYFLGGTCDITKKQGKFIDIRGRSRDIIPAVIRNLHRAKNFVLSHNYRVKFIGVPIYLVSVYNDVKGHLNTTVFLNSDKEVEFQVDVLNKHIEEINTQLGSCRNTLKFNADLRDTIVEGKRGIIFNY